MSSRPRSRAACDTCRLRKTRCVKNDNQDICVLCSFHGLRCTFRRGPSRKQRHQRTVEVENTPEQVVDTQDNGEPSFPSPDVAHSSPQSNDDGQVRPSTYPAAAYPSILSDTLGLDPSNNAEYIGSSDYRDPILLDLRQPTTTTGADSVRRMDDRTLFVIHPDAVMAAEGIHSNNLESIEAVVRPNGSRLVDLYFRFVHPSYPILHKDVFIAKHRVSHRHLAPSLLAAVYLLSLDWKIHDSVLASGDATKESDIALLERLAETALEEEMRQPKLSTLEAGLLLLQRNQINSAGYSNSSIWRLHARVVAISYDLGLHINCKAWSIPEWESGLRRRLGWALYIQDRWTAFVHGRPMLLQEDDWDLQPCSSSDFPEYNSLEGLEMGGVAAPTGWRLFLSHIELAQILNQVYRTYYTTNAQRRDGDLDRMGVRAAVDLAQPILLRLSQWKSDLPDDLSFTTSHRRSLCASASLHLAYHAVIIALYRALVRILTPHTPQSLHAAVRSAAKQKLEAAVQLLSSMSPEHTAAFWGGVASYQAAMIGAFAGLLWATAESSEEMTWCVMRLDDLKWALRIRGAAAPFARQALQLLERETGSFSAARQTEGSQDIFR